MELFIQFCQDSAIEGNEKQKNEIKIFFILVQYTDFWCFFIPPMIMQII